MTTGMQGVWLAVGLVGFAAACARVEAPPRFSGADGEVKLVTLDPGHFHAGLVQKTMYKQVAPTAHVYAPEGPDLDEHLKRISGYNTRPERPTAWQEVVYKGPDFLAKMLAEKRGNVAVLSGNNQKKTEYIKAAVDAGFHVLSDKPMVIDAAGFELLRQSFASAAKQGVLLYDIMTERYEISTMLQKAFAQQDGLFGKLEAGTPEQPAVTKESVHHFFKYVSGSPLKRPAWFFDVAQQGHGLVDVTTHLVDLIQWECFPEQELDYTKDIRMQAARRWTTVLTPAQFKQATQLETYPDYLKKDVADGNLAVYSNGEMVYCVKGVWAKVSVIWNFEPPAGAGDTHYSIMRGSRCNLVIRQGAEQKYKPTLYIEPLPGAAGDAFAASAQAAAAAVAVAYPGVALQPAGTGFEVTVPDNYKVGHEAHFAQVTEKYLRFLAEGRLPPWEVPNMLAKYYTTTRALEMALRAQP